MMLLTIGWRVESMQEFQSVYRETDGGILFNGNALEESKGNDEECGGCATEVCWQQGFYTTKLTKHVQIWTE